MPIKGTMKMTNSQLTLLSSPLLIRTNNSYTMNPGLSHKTQLSLSVPKNIFVKKNNDFYTLAYNNCDDKY